MYKDLLDTPKKNMLERKSLYLYITARLYVVL